MTLSELQSRFAIPNILRFEAGPGGLLRALVQNRHASATIYLHGAHLAEYQPAGKKPILFTSAKSTYDPTKPIRGGIPLVFPWFGPRAGDPLAPIHGFVRTMQWEFESASQTPDNSTRLVLSVSDTAETRRIWPHPFVLTCIITIGPSIQFDFDVHNPSPDSFKFEQALHTYFAVGDVRQVSITGLAGAAYIDKTDGMRRKTQDNQPIRITAETDRVYLNAQSTVTIEDPSLSRRIIVEKSGSSTTVVWNPWIAKAKAMPDFGDEEWPKMLCIETANAADNAITLAPGQHHLMRTTVRN